MRFPYELARQPEANIWLSVELKKRVGLKSNAEDSTLVTPAVGYHGSQPVAFSFLLLTNSLFKERSPCHIVLADVSFWEPHLLPLRGGSACPIVQLLTRSLRMKN